MPRWIRGSRQRRTREGENSGGRDCARDTRPRGGETGKEGSIAAGVEDAGDDILGLAGGDGGRGRGRYRRVEAEGGRSDRGSGLDGDVVGGGCCCCEARYDHLADPTPCTEGPYPCRGPWWPEHSGQARRAARLVGGQLLETHAASIDALAGPRLAGEWNWRADWRPTGRWQWQSVSSVSPSTTSPQGKVLGRRWHLASGVLGVVMDGMGGR